MISAIAAVGNNWQLGFNGGLPWPHHAEDMAWFREITAGKVMVAGHNTYRTIKHLDGTLERKLMLLHDDSFEWEWHLNQRYLDQGVVIVGGAYAYQQTATLIDQLYLSRIDYDGPADCYFLIDVFTPEQIKNAIWRTE